MNDYFNHKKNNMRRAHAGQYYEPLPQNYDANHTLEEENELKTDELKDKINVLKSLSIEIVTEVKYQDRIIRDMDDDFERTGGFLGKTISRVGRLAKGGHNYYIFYLFLFSLLIFFILWLVIKFR